MSSITATIGRQKWLFCMTIEAVLEWQRGSIVPL